MEILIKMGRLKMDGTYQTIIDFIGENSGLILFFLSILIFMVGMLFLALGDTSYYHMRLVYMGCVA